MKVRRDVENITQSHILMVPATAEEDSQNKMWSGYMKEAGEYDKRMVEDWKEDAMGLLVFVRTIPLIRCGCDINYRNRPDFFLQPSRPSSSKVPRS
jgi:hypothetical protein